MTLPRLPLLFALMTFLISGSGYAQLPNDEHSYSRQIAEFAEPPADYRPETWFHLIGGNVNADALSVDLQAVADAGFRGVQLFHGRGREWPGVSPQIQTLSPNWDGLIAHVGKETERLGLDFTMQNCPGWAMSGGPWIKPEEAMRHLIWSRQEVRGGQKINLALNQPQPSKEEWRDYRDESVLAFPTPVGGTGEDLRPVSVRSNLVGGNWTALLAGEEVTVEVPADDQPTWVEVTFTNVVTLRSLAIPPVELLMKRRNFDPSSSIRIEAWKDGAWRSTGKRDIPRGVWQDRQPEMPLVLAFDDLPANRFRIVIDNDFPMSLTYLRLNTAAKVNDWRGQAGFALRSLDYGPAPKQDPAAFVDPAKIIDLTNRFQNGNLSWDAPPGDWTILRFGHVNTGITNKPAPPEATGFECDKLSPRGAEAHFAGYIGRLTEAGAPIDEELDGMLIDSWECYTQTWTPAIEGDFEERRGYKLRSWLPALAGYVIKNHRTSERFLRDWRATISDLLVDNYFGRLAELGRERGLKLSFETAMGDVSPGDILQYYSKADIPMCEFWQPNDPHWGGFETKPIHPAVSAARIYGKPVIAAEAFTNVGIQWNEHPFVLKHRADQHFALGINHLVFHTYTHNPRQDVVPGTSFGGRIGTPFIRGQTWWSYMPAFTDYLARCQRLLQTGQSVADVLWYLGDDLDHKPRQNHPFPQGYKFDYVNFDALVNRITVEDGWLLTPEGLRWRVLWMPATTCQGLLPATLKKVNDLLEAGATVVGPPPLRNPSLVGGDGAQVQWDELVKAVWGNAPAMTGDRRIGKGRLLWGKHLGQTLVDLNIVPDVPGVRSLSWEHRRTSNQDIYFLSADRLTPINGTLRFLTEGTPELWDAMTGKTTSLPVFSREGEYTHVPIQLPAAGSVFVIFRKETTSPGWASVSRDGEPIATTKYVPTVDGGAPYPYTGVGKQDALQPWIHPATPELSWMVDGRQAVAWKSGTYTFKKPDDDELSHRTTQVSRMHLTDGWQLSFPEGWDAPTSVKLTALGSWTDLAETGARVFSGTATYRNTFSVEELSATKQYLLDLGRVANLVEVSLNGTSVAKLWAPPFRTDLTPYLRSGENELVVRVTNTWHNRLSYDAGLAEGERKTWTFNAPSAEATPEPAGLLGPVTLHVGELIGLE